MTVYLLNRVGNIVEKGVIAHHEPQCIQKSSATEAS